MVVDSSIILAIYFNRPGAVWALGEIESRGEPLSMSTVSLADCVAAFASGTKPSRKSVSRRSSLKLGRHYKTLVERLLSEPIEFVPPSKRAAELAGLLGARSKLGPAECFSYGLAKESKECLLTLERGLLGTDIRVLAPRR